MNMQKLIGVITLLAAFAVLFFILVGKYGFINSLASFLISTVFTLFVVVGSGLIVGIKFKEIFK